MPAVPALRVRILGPVECDRGGRRCEMKAGQLVLLTALVLRANRAVSTEWLADTLWDEPQAAGGAKRVQMAIARLRKAIEPAGPADPVLVTVSGGYMLRVAAGELDLDDFEAGVQDGLRQLAAGDPIRAGDTLRQALALWRGPPLAELACADVAQDEIRRLEERRLTALEARIDADLASGKEAELSAELGQLSSAHPYRERLHAQRMLALYRAGRQADALAAYREARAVLLEQLGIEPSGELRALEAAILAQDESLFLEAPPTAAGRRRELPVVGRREHWECRALPIAPNPTIGRARELAVIAARLREPTTRLLTLLGPGGVGKTRLALEVAHALTAEFADGARVVTLSSLQRPDDVPGAVVAGLGIVALAGESPADAVQRFLARKRLLLVMDNFEHVLEASPVIGGWLETCPGVTILATSREPLAVRAEHGYPVSPLRVPEPATTVDPDTLAGVDAVSLFCERAQAHDPELRLSTSNAAAVAEICRRVDGLPLAIELAAARAGLLSPAEIAERLDDALGHVEASMRDSPARHRTMRSAILWSYELLDEEERACFTRFAAFAGGATVAAAETVTGCDWRTLERLAGKSLLVRIRRHGAPTRLAMLETIRSFAAERFEDAVDAEAVRGRHYRHFLQLAQRHGTDEALSGSRHRDHLARLDTEAANLTRALTWALERSDAARALEIVAALGGYWLARNRHAEAVQWLDAALRLPAEHTAPAARVRALCTKVHCLWPLGRLAEQPAVTAELHTIAQRSDDPLVLSRALRTCSWSEKTAGRTEQAAAFADEAMEWARRADDAWELARAASSRAVATTTAHELRERVRAAAALLEQVGNLRELADLLASASYTALCLGQDADAKAFIDRALPITEVLEDRLARMLVCGDVGLVALVTGDIEAAEQAFGDELRQCRELVVRPLVSEGLCGLAAVAARRGQLARAARLAGAGARHLHGRRGDPIDDRLDADFVRPARDRCEPAVWEAWMREGTTLGFEDAIAYAVAGLDRRAAHTRASTPAYALIATRECA